jgi:hypothetical protein
MSNPFFSVETACGRERERFRRKHAGGFTQGGVVGTPSLNTEHLTDNAYTTHTHSSCSTKGNMPQKVLPRGSSGKKPQRDKLSLVLVFLPSRFFSSLS